MLKLIIFDWDDVITLGSKEGYFRCYHEALREVGVMLPAAVERQRIVASWGRSYREVIANLLKEDSRQLDQACKLYQEKKFGATFISSLYVLPGLNELLILLKDKYILAVATSSNSDLIKDGIMPRLGIPDVFQEIISVHDLNDSSKAKPSPHLVNILMTKFGVMPDQTCVVGDAINDVLMAQAAGTTPIVVLTGHLNRQTAEQLGVKKIINNVMELETVLEL